MGIWAILFLPLLVVGFSGIVYIYRKVTQLMTKSAVRSKVVVVTDALSGVGKECAQVFHSGGARLILCGKHLDKLEVLCDALNSAADPTITFTPKPILLDLTDVNCIQDVAKEILDCYGCVDILINNASTKAKGTVQNVSLELDKKIMDANYFGPITLTKAFLPNMISRRTGQIVLVNNIQGKLGVPFRAAYSASKHAALGFFDCLRAELKEFGVCVSTVSPSFICSYHNQLQPKNCEGASWKNFFRKSAYGVRPTEVAEEILRTVNRKKQEVFMANPIAKAAVYIRTFFPEIFFAVVAAGVKEKQKIEVEN
ncbi:PREDICTED: dehydrogenase/reductase SDR family member 7C [Thamnophis sirtalis]|uniref:Dehydrogenase/reductase SDR family member 7C n=1 Tax=Thamnophis sirtalis TaxID=35019 RepID=A0A6I9XAZ1_9SAUR|nr:PREDICTED: dehydrogenase/reductase SDR family member 7C [Thamnophis sirtalis]